MIISFIIGVFGGFTIAILISYGKVIAREEEIKLLQKQNKKYKEFIENHPFYYDDKFVKKEDDNKCN